MSEENIIKKKKKLIFVICSILIITIAVTCGIIYYQNSFNTSIQKDSFSCNYEITETSISISLTANVNIQDFDFDALCGTTESVLYQYSKRYKVNMKKNETIKYTYKRYDIEQECPWAKDWKFNFVKITNYTGKIQNKNK